MRCDNLRWNVKIRTDATISEQPFIMKAGIPSISTDFDGRSSLVALCMCV
jgi:hypothetical protein